MTPAKVLFVLLPAAGDDERLTAGLPAGIRLRRYPPADDARHLASLLRAGRDRLATRWRRGAAKAIAGGAVLGAVVNGVLAGAFDMLGGLLEIAVPLGGGLGAFLGGFTAAMTGTERPRDELQALMPHVQPGSVLLQFSSDDRDALLALAIHCEQQQLPWLRLDA